jgi:DNA-directed RNA polymerase subunit M/transcription elongation factor TFIIS
LDLIYDPFFKCVCERYEYEKHIGCMEWKCAICGNSIIIDRRKNDPENFVCEFCKESYNNKNPNVDRRILESRNEMYKELVKRIYDEFEDSLFYKG